MKIEVFIYSWVFSHFFLIVRSGGQTVQNTIKCYQCEIEGKDPSQTCGKDDLKVCPNTFAADRCLTNIKRNGSHYHITKKCALAPCDLPAIQSSLLKLTSSCDQSRDEFSCYTCCDSDGCNLHNSAQGIHHLKASSRGRGMSFILSIACISTGFFLISSKLFWLK